MHVDADMKAYYQEFTRDRHTRNLSHTVTVGRGDISWKSGLAGFYCRQRILVLPKFVYQPCALPRLPYRRDGILQPPVSMQISEAINVAT